MAPAQRYLVVLLLALTMPVAGCTMFSSPDDYTTSGADTGGTHDTGVVHDTAEPPNDTIIPGGVCDSYCEAFMATCGGGFADMTQCWSWCQTKPAGFPMETGVDSIHCRIGALTDIFGGPDACLNAGPQSPLCGDGPPPACEDLDRDGAFAGPDCSGPRDCHDMDASVGPGFEELCDGKDNNCDNEVDEGCTMPPCSGGSSCACVNDQDMVILYDPNMVADAAFKNCSDLCAQGDPFGCETMCVQESTGLTAECSTCFSGLISCTVDKCLDPCTTGDGTLCIDCQEANYCTTDFYVCSGLGP